MKLIKGVLVGAAGGVSAGGKRDDISEFITKASVSLTSGMVSQVTFSISDPGLQRLKANYYQFRQRVSWLNQNWEVAAIEVRQGNVSEEVTLSCRLEAVQKLKRAKGAQVFPEGSPTAFAAARAAEVGLNFFGEPTPPKGNISRVRNDQTDESTWNVLQRLAGENSFILFESDNRLFFCSQQFLLGKFALGNESSGSGFLATVVEWGKNNNITQTDEDSSPTIEQAYPPIVGPSGRPTLSIGIKGSVHVSYLQRVLKERGGQPIVVDGWFGNQTLGAVLNLQNFFGLSPSGVVGAQTWEVVDFLASGIRISDKKDSPYKVYPMNLPTLRRSDDAPEEITGSFQVDHQIGVRCRPGMTVLIEGVPGFSSAMLVTSVSWDEGSTAPVTVQVATPTLPASFEERNAALAKIDYTGGGFTTIPNNGFFL